MMGPCRGCGRPARLSGLCGECRTANEIAMRSAENARIDRIIRAEHLALLGERRDEA